MSKPASPRKVGDKEALSVGTQIRGSAQKLNLVAGLIRGKRAGDAPLNRLTAGWEGGDQIYAAADLSRRFNAAAERVREILDNAENDHIGLRIGIKNGGCAGQEYTFAYADEIGPMDEVVEDKGVTILIEPKAVLFLIGTEIDFETTKLASKFVFRNPNETDACGCGESVTIVPAREDA